MASFGRWKIPQTRSGRRSISVHRLLEKERSGTLFKKHAGGKAHGVPTVVTEEMIGRLLERRGENKDGSLKHAFKLDGETTFQGLDIAIENGVGSTRKGENADGSKWSVKYKTPYGYIRGTTGADGEELDVYVGPERDADTAYVVHQKKDDGSYDEDTVMLGYDSKASAKADILRHYSDPKYVGSVDAIPMEKLHGLVEAGKKLVKISDAVGFRSYVDEDETATGIPAHLRKRPGEVPLRDEVDVPPKIEDRQANRATVYVGGFASPGGENDVGKFAAALETLGQLSRSWEVPSTEEHGGIDLARQGAREKEPTGTGTPFRTLSEIGTPAEDSGVKAAAVARAAFIDELQKVGAAHGYPPWAGELAEFERYVEAFTKTAGFQLTGTGAPAEMTRQDAQSALQHLEELEATRPTTGQLLSGAALGATIGPISSNVNKLISSGHLNSPREIAGQVAGGLLFGTAMPYAKHELESGAERRKLRQYVDAGHGGRLATQIENKLGTP
jgi:hypothetical protein